MNAEKIRLDFPILEEKVGGKPLVYLDNAATTHKPGAVLDRLIEFYTRMNSNVHRGVHSLSREASGAYEGARETVRSFIGARSAKEVIFTRGTTDGINLIADIFRETVINAGDEVLVTEMEHHSNLIPWQAACAKKGAVLKVLPFDGEGRLKTDELDGMLTDKTRIMALSYISNVLGTENPVKDIVRTARSRGVPVLVDGAQAVQHIKVDVRELDCDFFVFSGHKMYAPTGIGVLYGKKEWLDRLSPYRYGGGMVNSVSLDRSEYAEAPFKFEAGTGSLAEAVSLAAAIGYMDSIGMEGIKEHERRLSEMLCERLAGIGGVTVYGPPSGRRGVVSFNLEGAHPYDVGTLLDKMGIAVRTGTHCAEPVMKRLGVPGTVRASFAVYNTEKEIEKLAGGVKKIRAIL
ncbi:MAG: SufS family cysteine desulfurase [Candidatus Omnitrophica bacterium]|nr:SufS family cysteine desulfurase [Candidatus Omnitrophota bacterium]